MSFEKIQLEPLTGHIGALIHGVDLSQPQDDPTIKEIRQALLEHQVIFFRNQDITPEQHVDFARKFGELEVHPFLGHLEGSPEVLILRHDENIPGVENIWHSDVTWRQEPSLGSILKAIELPDVGGDTLFSNMYLAYEGLSSAIQGMLDGLVAVHDYMRAFGRFVPPEKQAEMRKEYPLAEHPVVRTHPETGKKGLYVNWAFTSHIKGMKPWESDSLLDQLYQQSRVPEYQVRFKWEEHSIAFWDNRACQHYAVNDYYPKVRHMHRVTIAGDKPY